MTSKSAKRLPVIGCAFDPEQRNEVGNVQAMVSELEWYRPAGFSSLVREARKIIRQLEKDEEAFENEWEDECMDLLTSWARRVTRNDYVTFIRDGGFAGFTNNVDSFLEDAELRVDDLGQVPKGFSGLVAQVSDHGNVTAYSYSRGRARELFSAV